MNEGEVGGKGGGRGRRKDLKGQGESSETPSVHALTRESIAEMVMWGHSRRVLAASFDAALEPLEETVTTVTVVVVESVEDDVKELEDDDPPLDTTGPERKLLKSVLKVLLNAPKWRMDGQKQVSLGRFTDQ
jgi:hypothetical protein